MKLDSLKSVMDEFGIGKSTFYDIKQNKKLILDFVLKQDMPLVRAKKRKWTTGAKYGDVNNASTQGINRNAQLVSLLEVWSFRLLQRDLQSVLGKHTSKLVLVGFLYFEIGTQLGTEKYVWNKS